MMMGQQSFNYQRRGADAQPISDPNTMNMEQMPGSGGYSYSRPGQYQVEQMPGSGHPRFRDRLGPKFGGGLPHIEPWLMNPGYGGIRPMPGMPPFYRRGGGPWMQPPFYGRPGLGPGQVMPRFTPITDGPNWGRGGNMGHTFPVIPGYGPGRPGLGPIDDGRWRGGGRLRPINMGDYQGRPIRRIGGDIVAQTGYDPQFPKNFY